MASFQVEKFSRRLGQRNRSVTKMKQHCHAEMGIFTQDKYGDFFQIVKTSAGRIRLILNFAFDEQKAEEHLRACERIAVRFHARIADLVEDARSTAAHKLLDATNRVRDIEGKKLITSDFLMRRLKLLDVCVAPTDFIVTFTGSAYDDEHRLYRVRYGPRCGWRDVYIE